MVRTKHVLDLLRSTAHKDITLFNKTIEQIISDANKKNQKKFAKNISSILSQNSFQFEHSQKTGIVTPRDTLYQITATRSLEDLILPHVISLQVNELIEEHQKRDVLRSYNLEPKNRILLYGPPGNGKTSLAEAISEKLAVPLYILKYEEMIDSLLGKSASKLNEAIAYVKSEHCVLFLDEFESIAKERGDKNENGEIKRIVSSLLLQVDKLPPHVVLITATNHTSLIDRAFWRRFQFHMHLPNPEQSLIEKWFENFQKSRDLDFGISSQMLSEHFKDHSFSDLESFSLDIQRRYVMNLPHSNLAEIITQKLKQWSKRIKE